MIKEPITEKTVETAKKVVDHAAKPHHLAVRFGLRKFEAHAASMQLYIKKNNLDKRVTPQDKTNLLLASLSTGLHIDGNQAYIVPKGSTAIFIPSYAALLRCFEKQYKKPLWVTCYYPCQTDHINKPVGYREQLSAIDAEGNPISFYKFIKDNTYRDNPSVVQVGYDQESCTNFVKEELDEKTKTVQSMSSTWRNHKLEMYKKTAIKAFFKFLPFGEEGDNLKSYLYNAEEDHTGNW